MAEAWIHPGWRFLDAGSGDGRVLILASAVLGLKAYGVEYDERLWRRSLKNIAALSFFYPDVVDLPQVWCGDFCDEDTFSRNGTAFKAFDVIFNYANDHHRLAAKVAEDATRDVLFLYYGPQSFPESFPGLIPVKTLALGGEGTSARSYMHAYRKKS